MSRKSIAHAVAALAVGYGAMAFTQAQINPAMWDEGDRWIALLLALFTAWAALALRFLNEGKM